MRWNPADHDDLVRLVAREVSDERIVDAFRHIRREDFVPAGLENEAYEDHPVPLPHRQTTSQPSLIARMIEAAAIGPDDVVLEVGTGFGFQTALMASLAKHVVSIERYVELVDAARTNLTKRGIENIEVVLGDGWDGSPEHAPFDAIVVSAAAESLPEALTEQLADGGRLVIPLRAGIGDNVVLFVREGDRVSQTKLITPARFVPLVRGVDA
jgi:protein-L-isoaspartate(D-aspartate) O-methyltransferase